jgi:hypothetical protein
MAVEWPTEIEAVEAAEIGRLEELIERIDAALADGAWRVRAAPSAPNPSGATGPAMGAPALRQRSQVLPQQNSVTPLLACEVFPARSTAFTVNVFAPLSVA